MDMNCQKIHTIVVQKFNFDKKPNIFTSFSTKFFLTIFLVKSKLSTAKMSKTTTFSQVFHHEKSTSSSRNPSWIFEQKWRFRTVWFLRLFLFVDFGFLDRFITQGVFEKCSKIWLKAIWTKSKSSRHLVFLKQLLVVLSPTTTFWVAKCCFFIFLKKKKWKLFSSQGKSDQKWKWFYKDKRSSWDVKRSSLLLNVSFALFTLQLYNGSRLFLGFSASQLS